MGKEGVLYNKNFNILAFLFSVSFCRSDGSVWLYFPCFHCIAEEDSVLWYIFLIGLILAMIGILYLLLTKLHAGK